MLIRGREMSHVGIHATCVGHKNRRPGKDSTNHTIIVRKHISVQFVGRARCGIEAGGSRNRAIERIPIVRQADDKLDVVLL